MSHPNSNASINPTTQDKPTSLSYKDAGVDIDAGDALVQRIKSVAKATTRPEVVGGLGGFGALCRIPTGYKSPLLVSGTDGVGTKLKLALQLERHDTIGIDLVAMCVNDLLVCSRAHSRTLSVRGISGCKCERPPPFVPPAITVFEGRQGDSLSTRPSWSRWP